MKRRAFLFRVFILALFLVVSLGLFTPSFSGSVPKGVWVSVFSVNKVLYSKEAVKKLILLCKEAKISHIYLQVYQSGQAYYDTKEFSRLKYEEILKISGEDTIDFLLKEAKANDIQVFAWINLLSLGNNLNADIIKKFGKDVLTKDRYLRPSGRGESNDSDKYYLREELLFLEPGDQRVVKFLTSLVEELVDRYPSFSGVHLDYTRYPMTVPFIPGSRFTNYGLSYGYGVKNMERFKDWARLDPLTGLNTPKDYMLWDDWRRNQITALVRSIAKSVKERSKELLVSSAVVASSERAYSSLFQDWPLWLEEGILDYVVIMNYTIDNRLAKELTLASLALKAKGKVFIGLGLYLMKENVNVFISQYKAIEALSPDGIVIFSYDDITDSLVKCLSTS